MKRLEDCKKIFEQILAREPLLVCYLDGFGYSLYRWAVEHSELSMSKQFSIEPIRSVEPPITNPAMGTILTGQPPQIHGIYSHKDRRLLLPTIFDSYLGESLFLEGDSNILSFGKRPILHVDRDGIGVDEWIYQDVCKGLRQKIPFIFAHFHQIDDVAHEVGPYHEKTLKQIRIADAYIHEFTELSDGEIILVSDHGVRQIDGEGIHGENVRGSSPWNRCEEEILAIWGERNDRVIH